MKSTSNVEEPKRFFAPTRAYILKGKDLVRFFSDFVQVIHPTYGAGA
jgi:hypothetical protein